MRTDLAPVSVGLIYLLPGFAILAGLGIVGRRTLGALAAVGLAYMAGLSAVLLTGTWLLVAGIPVTVESTALIAMAIAAAGFAAAFLRQRRAAGRGSAAPSAVTVARLRGRLGDDRWERLFVVATGALLLAVVVYAYLASRRLLLVEWDSWSIWTRKAHILLEYGTPRVEFFADPAYEFMHPDYPLLVPLMEATWFRFAGFADTQGVHAQFYLVLVGFVAAAAYIVGRSARPVIWLPILGLLTISQGAWSQLMSLYADVPMALFLGLGVLLLGRWLESAAHAELALAALMLAAAASSKNEGLVAAVAAVAAAAVATLLTGRGRLRAAAPMLVAGAAIVATALPWRVWLASHGISGDMPVRKGLDPTYLADHFDRVGPTINALTSQISDQGAWLYFVPLGAAAAVAALLTPGRRRLGGYYVLVGLLVFGSIVWAYWIAPTDLGWHLHTSARRTVVGVVVVGLVAALHLAGAGSARATPEPTDARQPAGSLPDATRGEPSLARTGR